MINEEEPLSDLELYAEQIAEDISKAVDKWLRPELAKVIGWPATNGIKDQDFESVLACQYKLLWMEMSKTHRKNGAILYFKLCQGPKVKNKFTVLSKLEYKIDFDKYKSAHE
jgi:hypothetical protein